MNKDQAKLARLLTDGRAQTGLTQRAVEAATGISNAYLSQLESGKIREPSPSILHKLSEVYGLRYADLLASAGYPVPTEGESTLRSRLAARIGPTTEAEEEALVEYLDFLRSKKQRRPQA